MLPLTTPESQIIVSTVDVVRYTFLISTDIKAHIPLLLVGPTGGCGFGARVSVETLLWLGWAGHVMLSPIVHPYAHPESRAPAPSSSTSAPEP